MNNTSAKKDTKSILIGITLVALIIATVGRLFPHLYNFTPIAALALFLGSTIKNKYWAYAIPILCLLVTDGIMQARFWLGYEEYQAIHLLMPVVYLCFGLWVLIGRSMVKPNKWISILKGTIMGSVIFFLLTNFAVWAVLMPNTFESFVQCYAQAIPFFRSSLLGNFFYGFAFFGIYNLVPTLSSKLNFSRN